MKGFQCDELFAFVALDQDGNEGVVMAESQGTTIPLVCSSLETVKVFVPLAAHIAKQEKINIKLYHYRRLGEVASEFIEQFIGVRLEGDPSGAGEVPVHRDDSDPEQSPGGSDNGDETTH